MAQAVDSKSWDRLRAETVGRRQMSQLTLGILGLGRVGKRLARAASGIGFKVIYNDLLEIAPDQRHGATPVAVEQLFESSDIVSIHIDGRASNRNFVNARLIERMKPEVIFINTSRGFVVDNLPLAKFLKNHPEALAMLDVHEPEPFGAEYPLLGLPNARLYPHLASRTDQAMDNMSWVVRDVVKVLEGHEPMFPA
jgi:phosphoglycerate dehydrogenase-like enzyme